MRPANPNPITPVRMLSLIKRIFAEELRRGDSARGECNFIESVIYSGHPEWNRLNPISFDGDLRGGGDRGASILVGATANIAGVLRHSARSCCRGGERDLLSSA